MRYSQSFNEAEVEFLLQLFRIMLRGGSVTVLARNPILPKLAAKIHKMRVRGSAGS